MQYFLNLTMDNLNNKTKLYFYCESKKYAQKNHKPIYSKFFNYEKN